MAAIVEVFTIFAVGGVMYGIMEIAFRGFTHWTMIIAGGLCSLFLYIIKFKSREPIWKRCIMGGSIITTIEFLFGAVVNITLKWNVWDYSGHAFNLFGQICLIFSALWTILSAPAMWLLGLIGEKWFKSVPMKNIDIKKYQK